MLMLHQSMKATPKLSWYRRWRIEIVVTTTSPAAADVAATTTASHAAKCICTLFFQFPHILSTLEEAAITDGIPI
jgi:hypothetical protein